MSSGHGAQIGARDEKGKSLSAAGWPNHLIKAVYDYYMYRLRLRTGEEIDFVHAEPCQSLEWVRLIDAESDGIEKSWTERGLEVHVADIVWVADSRS